MNLRDKLKAIEKPKSPPKASEKQFTDCYHGREMRELSEFPGAFDLDLSALRLMTQEELPDDLARGTFSIWTPKPPGSWARGLSRSRSAWAA